MNKIENITFWSNVFPCSLEEEKNKNFFRLRKELNENILLALKLKENNDFTPLKREVDIVIIESELIYDIDIWAKEAKKANKEYDFYCDFFHLAQNISKYKKNCNFVFGSSYKTGESGEEVARLFYDMGFENIYLVDDDEKQEKKISWIKGLVKRGDFSCFCSLQSEQEDH